MKRKHVLKMHPSQGYGKGFGRGDSVRQDGPCDPLLTLYYSGPAIQLQDKVEKRVDTPLPW